MNGVYLRNSDLNKIVELGIPYLEKAGFDISDKEFVKQCLEAVIEDSHTCYNGDRSTKQDWGYGCGECPACDLRAKGYQEYQNQKKTA